MKKSPIRAIRSTASDDENILGLILDACQKVLEEGRFPDSGGASDQRSSPRNAVLFKPFRY